jgi:hypothetical protein
VGARDRDARGSVAASSLAALRTATKLTIDVAEWHEKVHPHSTGTLTPNYAHMATAALRQLENGLLEEDKAWLSNVEAQLRGSLSRFHCLWRKTGK